VTANRLRAETSPYLRQHADNPVDWYPWGDEALSRARDEDKPLFVSIGYASCHWCHVMAHESFEDPVVGDQLADSFISVKIDREERPDLDAVYMAAVQAQNGSGGWPMSVFCTPDGRPFFAGTYFPPADRPGSPGFRRILAILADAWATRRPEVERQADALADAVRQEVRLADELARRVGGRGDLPGFDRLLGDLVAELSTRFDDRWGGFGPAPKFPRPTMVELCLWHHQRTGDQRSLEMATTTLDAMATGGLYDHLAGGFARYSTDTEWLVPHFEKMLTDQALLARAYLHAFVVTGRSDYRQVVTETLDYVLDRLSSPAGGLFSSEDADAAGVEGGHATFTPAQVTAALTGAGRPELVGPAIAWYHVTEQGNWEGTTVLRRPLAGPLVRPAEIESARRLLLEARDRRPQPATDDKVLTEWSAMTAAVLAEAAAVTGTQRWADRAVEVAEFLFTELRRPADSRWLRSWQDGRANHLALAADYAWVVEMATRVAELTGETRWLDRAVAVADQLLEGFWDGPAPGSDGAPDGPGGLFTTGHDAEALLVRPKDLLDGAVPSANSIAATALARLGALTGQDRFRAASLTLATLAAPLLRDHPMAVADLVVAVGQLEAGTEVVITGSRPDLVAETRRRWLPAAVVAWGQRADNPLWADRADDRAYVCHRFTCRAPVDTPGALGDELDRLVAGTPVA
jgi:uncharacterized protein YyaL (SSP411 family)